MSEGRRIAEKEYDEYCEDLVRELREYIDEEPDLCVSYRPISPDEKLRKRIIK